MSDLLGLATATATFASALRIATPLGLAATGEAVTERAGVLNVGVEGIMLGGALTAFLVSEATGSALAAVAAAILVGLLLSGILAALVLGLHSDQVVAGLGLNLLAFGAAGTAYGLVTGPTGSDRRLGELGRLHLPEGVPALLRLPFEQEPLFYVALGLALATAWVVARSRWGLALRAVGDHPLAADAAGIPVTRVRLGALLFGGTLAALAGADLMLAHARTFTEELTGGRGFMALALVLFGRWSPPRVVLAALFFGFAEAVQLRVQAEDVRVFGYPLARARELVLAIPYVLTLLVLALPRRTARDEAPAALGTPYRGRS